MLPRLVKPATRGLLADASGASSPSTMVLSEAFRTFPFIELHRTWPTRCGVPQMKQESPKKIPTHDRASMARGQLPVYEQSGNYAIKGNTRFSLPIQPTNRNFRLLCLACNRLQTPWKTSPMKSLGLLKPLPHFASVAAVGFAATISSSDLPCFLRAATLSRVPTSRSR
jgi:hypothetical protein